MFEKINQDKTNLFIVSQKTEENKIKNKSNEIKNSIRHKNQIDKNQKQINKNKYLNYIKIKMIIK